MKIKLYYKHERIVEDCEASENFSVEAPELQDGFYISQPLVCMWCGTEARLINKVLVNERTGPHSRACGITIHNHGPACNPNCPTCGGK